MKRLLSILTLIISAIAGQAQYVKIQDTAFLRYFQEEMPEVLSPELAMLDTAKTATLTGVLQIVNRPTITNISEIKYFTQITELLLNEISITEIPLDKNLVGLTSLTFPEVKVSSGLDLSMYPNFTSLNCGGSDVTEVIWPENTNMQRFLTRRCRLTSIPDFSVHPNLDSANIEYNFLSWKDILRIPYQGESDKVYSIFPQNNLTVDTLIGIHKNETLSLTYSLDTAVEGLQYTWYKDDIALTGIPNSATLEIPEISEADSGDYHVKVSLLDTETVFGTNTLRSGLWRVRVDTCQQMSSFSYDLIAGCSGETISVTEVNHSQNKEIGKMSFVEVSSADEYDLNLNEAISINEGLYKLTVVDINGCIMESEEVNISTDNTLLKGINYNNCGLEVLPDFNKYPLLEQVDLSNNYLSWEELLNLPYEEIHADLILFPQKNLTSDTLVTVHENDTFKLICPFDNGIDGLKFTWYKDGAKLTGIPNSPMFELAGISPEIAGVYFVEVSLLDAETVYGSNFVRSGNWTIEYIPCQQLLNINYELVEECKGQYITLSEVVGSHNEAIDSITLQGINVPDEYEISIDASTQVKPGSYTFFMVDEYRCILESDEIKISDGENCELIIYPFQGGMSDYVWLDGQGSVSVYNKNGVLVNSFQLPLNWGGTNAHNEILPVGVYLLKFEDSSTKQITIVH